MGSVPEKPDLDPSVAVKPSDIKSAAELSVKIGTLGVSLSPDDNESRLELLRQARSLVQALETPRETMVKHLWAQPGVGFVIAAGVESGLFKYMVAKPGPRKVKELGKDEYEATNFSKALSLPTVGDCYSSVVGEFQNFMAGYGQGRASWMDAVSYPVSERLIRGADTSPEAAFIIDIGGGIGRDLDEFCRKHPGAPGRHVLQDLPHVTA